MNSIVDKAQQVADEMLEADRKEEVAQYREQVKAAFTKSIQSFETSMDEIGAVIAHELYCVPEALKALDALQVADDCMSQAVILCKTAIKTIEEKEANND